jgi:2,5-dioxopentanoate dehydrogenase
MQIDGQLLIGLDAVPGECGELRALEAATGTPLEPVFRGASATQLKTACALAAQAFAAYRATSPATRARFLEAIADEIVELGDALVERCMTETGLPRARIEGERARTATQLRMFASTVREGSFLGVRIDPALPERQPFARPDLRLLHVPLGPVAVFGASNFPLAFSVAGGDTAAAFAAGCPVIVKAHSAHPGTSQLVGRAVQRAVRRCGLPAGTFSLLFDSGYEVGAALVQDPRIMAVGFTGSQRGGAALMRLAAARPEPIPVYAEMSSVNPVILFPGALAARAEAIGTAFAASLTLGAGQFCTNPGLVLAVDGADLDRFVASARDAVNASAPSTMLTPGIHAAYDAGLARMLQHPDVNPVAYGPRGAPYAGRPALFETSAQVFARDALLHEEIFGAAALIVRCPDLRTVATLLKALGGQLTISLHLDAADHDDARPLIDVATSRCGRVLVNGFGTGVEVTHAMVHGGPFPATADGRSTSVGSLAIERFLRPVCYQGMPDALLPDALKDANPFDVPRRIDGLLEAAAVALD